MKLLKLKIQALLILGLLIANLALSSARKAKRGNKWCIWPFCGGDNTSPNAELYRKMAAGILQVTYNSNSNSLDQCIPLAGEWGKEVDKYKDKIDYWPTTLGPVLNFLYQNLTGLIQMFCGVKDNIVKFLDPWFGRRKVFLEGKFSVDRKRFNRVFKNTAISKAQHKRIFEFLSNAKDKVVALSTNAVDFVRNEIVGKAMTVFNCGVGVVKSVPATLNLFQRAWAKYNQLKDSNRYTKAKFIAAALCNVQLMQNLTNELSLASRQSNEQEKYRFIGRGAGWLIRILLDMDS